MANHVRDGAVATLIDNDCHDPEFGLRRPAHPLVAYPVGLAHPVIVIEAALVDQAALAALPEAVGEAREAAKHDSGVGRFTREAVNNNEMSEFSPIFLSQSPGYGSLVSREILVSFYLENERRKGSHLNLSQTSAQRQRTYFLLNNKAGPGGLPPTPQRALEIEKRIRASMRVLGLLLIARLPFVDAAAARGALFPRSGALTVAAELRLGANALTSAEIALLSMKLRRECNVAALWSDAVPTLAEVCKEQATAATDFPGPLPVVFAGAASEVGMAVAAGASAVVLAPANAAAEALGVDVLWRVSSAAEVAAVADAGHGSGTFLVDGEGADVGDILGAIPPEAAAVVAISAMQADNEEVSLGRRLAAAGCRSLLVRGACVGDDEDVAYTRFVVGGLTSKMSSKFKIDGATGAANGHFGTSGGSLLRDSKTNWRRQRERTMT